jgi:membrane protein YdbS with pleckstrin-like domain
MTDAVMREPAHLVCRRAVTFWTVRAALGWTPIVAAACVWMVIGEAAPVWRIVPFVGLAVMACAHMLMMPGWRYRVHRWETTPDVVYAQSGWWFQERRIVPVARIQTVDVAQGPLERLFRLASITVTTASARGPVEIRGLGRPDAERLAAELAAQTTETLGDAT